MDMATVMEARIKHLEKQVDELTAQRDQLRMVLREAKVALFNATATIDAATGGQR